MSMSEKILDFDKILLEKLFGAHAVAKLEKAAESSLLGIVYQLKESFSNKPKFITFSMDEYEALWDFIINCCVIHDMEDPNLLLKWEKARLDMLVDLLRRKDNLIAKRMKLNK